MRGTWLLGLMGLSGVNCGTNAAVSQRFTAIVYEMGVNWGNHGKAFLVPVSTIRGLSAFLLAAICQLQGIHVICGPLYAPPRWLAHEKAPNRKERGCCHFMTECYHRIL